MSASLSGVRRISASADGEVWAVTETQQVFRYDSRAQAWQPTTGQLSDIAVGSATNIWGLDARGAVWKYVGGEQGWQPITGQLAQIAAAGDSEVWGVNASGDVWMYVGGETVWEPMGSGFKQIAVGSGANAWGIDRAGAAVCLTPPSPALDPGEEQWQEQQGRKRWDSKNKYDQTQSTHLWIVCRAAEVARGAPTYGQPIYDLIQPGAAQGQSEFHDALCEGLWDADEADPYRNSVVPGDAWYGTISATYKSHFYDPVTGQNWLHETSPTALTEGPKFFQEAVSQYKSGNIRAAGYNLGLSLHYLTDMTQPMHAANFTFLSSDPLGYHSAFETLAIQVMREVQITQSYVPSTLGAEPGAYIKAAATASRSRYPRVCSSWNLLAWSKPLVEIFKPWEKAVTPEIEAALAEGVTTTAQYLALWMQAAHGEQPKDDPRFLVQAYYGPKDRYWVVDQDGHLYRRDGWLSGWNKEALPSSAAIRSLWTDQEVVCAVAADGLWILTPDGRWSHTYPPVLTDDETPILDLQQVEMVAPALFWALTSTGEAFRARGFPPQIDWQPTASPTLTSISASSWDSAWGANAKDGSVWEFAEGQWQNRGSGVGQVSVDGQGVPWGISARGELVAYFGSSWQMPPLFGSWRGSELPDWGPLAWINARAPMLLVDQRGGAWAPSPLIVQGQNPWVPL